MSDIIDKDRLSFGSAVIGNDVEMIPEISFLDPVSDEVVLHAINSRGSEDSCVWEGFEDCFFSVEFGLIFMGNK